MVDDTAILEKTPMSIWTASQRTGRRRTGDEHVVIDGYGRMMIRGRDGSYRAMDEREPEPVVRRPVGPSEEDRRNYLSDTHCRRWVRDGLIAEDVDQVIAIIEAFAGVRTMPITSEYAERNQDSSAGLAVGLIGMGESILNRGADGFLERLIVEVRASLDERGSYWKGWDYDGPGAFHKACLKIEAVGARWKVRISVARSDPESRLAKSFGLKQCFLRADHHVTFETHGDDYAIPMIHLERAARLAGATEVRPAADVFADLMTPIGDSQFGCAVLHEDERIRVLVSIDDVRVPADWKYRQMIRDTDLKAVPEEWSARLVEDGDGARIVGRAQTWREWPDPWASGIHITVNAVDQTDPEHEAAAVEASNRIAGLWAGLRGAYRDSDV